MRYFISIRDMIYGQILIALMFKKKEKEKNLKRKKKKKDHKNRTIISEMAAIFVIIKVLFLWILGHLKNIGERYQIALLNVVIFILNVETKLADINNVGMARP